MEEGAATLLEAKERRDAYCHLLWDRTSLEKRRSRILKEEAHKIASGIPKEVLNTWKRVGDQESGFAFFFEHGWLMIAAIEPLSEEQVQIGLRFAQEFGITFNRYLELEQREQQNLQLKEMMLEQTQQLQTAPEMQMNLMPKTRPQIEGFDIAGRCIPATHVGGDFFNYYQFPDGRVAGVLADVTGHAMAAAIPLLIFHGILESLVDQYSSIEELVVRLNRLLHRSLPEHTFVSLQMGELDLPTSRMRLCNCGSPLT